MRGYFGGFYIVHQSQESIFAHPKHTLLTDVNRTNDRKDPKISHRQNSMSSQILNMKSSWKYYQIKKLGITGQKPVFFLILYEK
jgi:hypothetical protein